MFRDDHAVTVETLPPAVIHTLWTTFKYGLKFTVFKTANMSSHLVFYALAHLQIWQWDWTTNAAVCTIFSLVALIL